MIHARYAAILKASGPQRKAEAEDWAAAAAKEWRYVHFNACMGD